MSQTQRRTNTTEFKKILALVRGNDFAHAGEAEAIDLVFNNLPKNPQQILLDVGCGLGGTANYIAKQGWGKPVGFDIDATTIQYAKDHYTQIEFHQSDVNTAAEVIKIKADIIYIFNAFYAFSDQNLALGELRRLAHAKTILVIFDYVNLTPGPAKIRGAINPSTISTQLIDHGWQVNSMLNLNAEYEYWYQNFFNRLQRKKPEIIAAANLETFEYAYDKYLAILNDIKAKLIGGTLIYCSAK
jgi:cyclopropane fatty-acyl-phospholipid synthase-like methyltransferase